MPKRCADARTLYNIGFFATPADNFPEYFSQLGIFGRFPYLLPNLICAGLMLISIVAGYFFLEETHPQLQPWSNPTAEDIDQMKRMRADSSVLATQPTYNTPAANLTQESYGTFNEVSEEAVEEEWHLKADGTSR